MTSITARLISWYRRHRRLMPWREHTSAYRTWISEAMLQQTQVATVIPYFERFVKRFPSVRMLAEAPIDDVLKAWEGLGYYSRARHLKRAAEEMLARHDGRVPGDYDTLLTLPGIGPYMAAAIASIAFEKPHPVVDGNVFRVFTRFWAIRDDVLAPRTRVLLVSRLEPLIASAEKPSEFNQAIMELGALVCTPKSPRCQACPLIDACIAWREGDVLAYPVKKKRAAVPHYNVAVGLVRSRGRILIVKRPLTAMLGGLWELPGGKVAANEAPHQTVTRILKNETGLTAARIGQSPVASVRHTFSHFRITLMVFEVGRSSKQGGKSVGQPEFRWVRPADLARYAFPTATRKIFRKILE